MLFSKSIPPNCAYCKRGKATEEGTVLCRKRGVLSETSPACKAFRYDPLKRVPPRRILPDFSRFTDEDFTL